MEIKREDIEAIYDQGKDVMVDFVMNLIQEFTTKINELTERVNELEKQLAKNSHNSSKPPSSDGLNRKKRTRSQRKQSGKKSGGQHGHTGNTLEMLQSPDQIVKIKNTVCLCCGKSLKKVHGKGYEARQKFEIPAPVVEVTEYRAEITDCPYCGAESRAAFPGGITHKTQYGDYLRSIAVYFRDYQLIPLERNAEIFRDLFNVPLSEATIITASKRCEKALSGFGDWIRKKLKTSPVLNCDETGVNINGSLHWVHTAGTPLLTSYYVHKRRGGEAIDSFGILPGYTGRAVHDHLPVYFKYSCKHGLCNAHHIRELTYLHEHEGQEWAQDMIDHLLEIKQSIEDASENGRPVSTSLIKKYEARYKTILRRGFRNNPFSTENVEKKRGRPKRTNIQNMLIRLRDYQKEVLAFMYDPDVPFDNNLAERDLRMIKVQQKVSGLFRTFAGAEQFCLIRSYISTVKKQGMNVIDSIYRIISGNQLYLNFQS